MTASLDRTHDPERRSWVTSADPGQTDFPIQNLPFGSFSSARGARRVGVAIGDQLVDLHAAHDHGVPLGLPPELARAATLDPLLRQPGLLSDLRGHLSDWLDRRRGMPPEADRVLIGQGDVEMQLPTALGNYTDFYADIHHARAAGALLTPEDPLPRNYKWVPIAYHGRASSVQASGLPVRRPRGQQPPTSGGEAPAFGPTRRLDFELELGFYVGAGNPRGEPVPIGRAASHIAGYCLLNDWSARDVQRWEMFPLGPFLSKSFATSVSPWMVTPDALAPFRVPAMSRPAADPRPLPYLLDERDQSAGNLDVALEVLLRTRRMRDADLPAAVLLTSNARHLYWTPAQMLAHHASNGCDLRTGDLVGTGTISGPTEDQLGSLLELTRGGAVPAPLPDGDARTFLEDGDEVILRGRCTRNGFVPIGFGECRGEVLSAPQEERI